MVSKWFLQFLIKMETEWRNISKQLEIAFNKGFWLYSLKILTQNDFQRVSILHCIKFIDFFYKWAASIQNSITKKKRPTFTFEFGLNTENLKLKKTKNKNNFKLTSPFLAKNDKKDTYAFSNEKLSTLPKPKITA